MINAAEVVIWSADPKEELFEHWKDPEKFAALVKEYEANLDAVLSNPATPIKLVKLDRVILTLLGLNKIRDVTGMGGKVFADAKIVEIPDKSVNLVKLHLMYRPWMVNVMAGITSTGYINAENPKEIDALKRVADLCHDEDVLPCAVTVLTSKRPLRAKLEFNGRSAKDQVLTYTEMLRDCGVTYVVCSPQEAAAIRSESTFNGLQLVTPGIRMPGTPKDDQARTMTPAEAIAAGSDYLVIGRNLTNGDLRENFAAIDANLNLTTF